MALASTDCPMDLSQTLVVPAWTSPVVPALPPVGPVETVDVWGLPLARLDTEGTLELVDELIRRGRPGFFITANLHY
ncbi:MAG: hypothetical protein ACYC6Y_04490, partial [Thermoguttaceae bacterium]